MDEKNGQPNFAKFVEAETTAEHCARAGLRELLTAGKTDEALALAKRTWAEYREEQVTDSIETALEIIDEAGPDNPLNFEGLIGTLEIAMDNQDVGDKYEGLFKPVSEITPALPAPILGAKGTGGAVLTAGNVCLLSGQGGVAKSTLTASIALSFASASPTETGEMVALRGNIFNGISGDVMIASFEDAEGAISYRLHGLGGIWQQQTRDDRIYRALKEKILCAELPEPLYLGEGNDSPNPTRAWDYLWETATTFMPKLIVLDPIIGAYLSNGNDPPMVFHFVKALAREAGKIGAGVLLVGHSNKAARQSAKYDPYDAGHIAGTGAWVDAARGVMVLTTDKRKGNEGKTVLAIPKANFGPSYIETHVRHIYRDDVSDRMPYGMDMDSVGWRGNNDNTQTGGSSDGETELDTAGL